MRRVNLAEGFQALGRDFFRKGFGHWPAEPWAIREGRRKAVQRLQKAAKKGAAAPCRRLRAGAVLQRTVGRRSALASGWRRGRLGRLGGGGLGLGLGLALHVPGLVAALGLVVCERAKEAVRNGCGGVGLQSYASKAVQELSETQQRRNSQPVMATAAAA